MTKQEETNRALRRDEYIYSYLFKFIRDTYPSKTNYNNAVELAENIQDRINDPRLQIDIDEYVGREIQTFVDPEGVLKAVITIDEKGKVNTTLGFNNKDDVKIVGASPLRKEIIEYMGYKQKDILSRMFVPLDFDKIDPLCRQILEVSYYKDRRAKS